MLMHIYLHIGKGPTEITEQQQQQLKYTRMDLHSMNISGGWHSAFCYKLLKTRLMHIECY